MIADTNHSKENEAKARIFISYSRKDVAFVDRLEAALKVRGFEPLIDRAEIYAFEDWWKRIEALIGRADTIVFVLSPDAVTSDVALKEVEHAASLNKRFAPIVCRRADDTAIPEALRRLNFIFFDDPTHFDASADKLAEALQTDINWIRRHTEYGEAARRWAAGGRPGGLLLRSPVLEDAERWIASRPSGAPAPTIETQTLISDSRSGATRRRSILTGGLAAGLFIALALAGLAFWQRGIAVQERQIADLQRQRAEDTLAAATKTANSLVFDLAQRFRNTVGIPANLIRDILGRARALQEQLIKSGELTPDLKLSEAEALEEASISLLTIANTADALSAAEEGRKILADLHASDPGKKYWSRELSVADIDVGNVLVKQGNLQGALMSYRESAALREPLAKDAPDDVNAQLDLSTSYEVIGNIQALQGNLQDALTSHRASLAIRERMANANPTNADAQRDLWVSYASLGDVQRNQRNLKDALQSFRDGLALAERMAKVDPANAIWQGYLSASYQRVGDIQTAQDDVTNALASYRQSVAIDDKLAKSDTTNAEWQRNLAVGYTKVGDIQFTQGDLANALDSFRDGLNVFERLTTMDPNNSEWLRDLSFGHERMGKVQVAQNNLDDALQSYRASVTTRERLIKIDPTNKSLAHDLWIAYSAVASVQIKQGNLDDALTSDRAALAILDPLANSDSGNTNWQGDLSLSYNRIADLQSRHGNLDDALTSYRAALAILDRLAKSDPGNTDWQRDLAFSYDRTADLQSKQGNLDDALTSYRAALAIFDRLAKSDPDNTDWQSGLAFTYNRTADLQSKQGNLSGVFDSYQASLAATKRFLNRSSKQWPGAEKFFTSHLGDLAYNFILARDFAHSLEASDLAISLAPDAIWLYGNRAHALMFLGRTDEARSLYLKYRNEANVQDGKTWQTVILEDFTQLRKAGLANPLMAEIQSLF
jgi:tetratricopeptide (TPR) repeat protein